MHTLLFWYPLMKKPVLYIGVNESGYVFDRAIKSNLFELNLHQERKLWKTVYY